MAAQPWIDTQDSKKYKAHYQDLGLLGKRMDLDGGYEKFRESFHPSKNHNQNRKNNLIQKNLRDYENEQRRLDVMQSFFLHEHGKDMKNMQKFQIEQAMAKKGTEEFERKNRQEWAK